MTPGSTAPTFHVDPVALHQDPYPQLAQMQRQAPIAWVPELGATLITTFADIDVCEKNTEVFSSEQPGGPMNRLMGRNMMRKDGAEHRAERKLVMPSLSQRAVKTHWRAAFEGHIITELNALETAFASGPSDLVKGFATSVSGHVLREVTGLVQLSPQQLDWASQAMINGVSNIHGDEAVEAECHRATDFLRQAIHDAINDHSSLPQASMIRLLTEAGADLDLIESNVMLAISGGQNETRDVLAGAIWAVFAHELVGKTLDWNAVFDEFVRWMAPIGMSPRRISKDFKYKSVTFFAGSTVRLMFGIANRDPSRFELPDDFRPDLKRPQHMAFGAGPHFCAGAFVSRMAIAGLALPMFFDRFASLKLVGDVPFEGWAFRGPKQVFVSM